MNKITFTDIEDFMKARDLESSVILKDYDYASAFIGVTYEGNAVYDFDKMVEYLMEEQNMDEIDAITWIEFNTIRAIPYITEGLKPIILYDRI